MTKLTVVDGGKALDAELYGDFTVDEKTGEAFISQRKLAELIGMPQTTFNRWANDCGSGVNMNENKSIRHDSLKKAVILGQSKGYPESFELAEKLMDGGAKAYIYHQAGYQMEARPRLPQTYLEALKELVAVQEALEAAQPAIKFHSMMHTQNKTLSMNEYAKVLTDSAGVKIGQNKMMAYLRKSKILMAGRDATEKNRPHQRYMDAGWFEVNCVETRVGMRTRPLITPKGQEKLADRIVTELAGG